MSVPTARRATLPTTSATAPPTTPLVLQSRSLAARAVAEAGVRDGRSSSCQDAEEDGLLGSAYYATDPIVPLEQTVAYINFDIQGADLLRPSPTARSRSVETGGPAFVDAVTAAAGRLTRICSA